MKEREKVKRAEGENEEEEERKRRAEEKRREGEREEGVLIASEVVLLQSDLNWKMNEKVKLILLLRYKNDDQNLTVKKQK